MHIAEKIYDRVKELPEEFQKEVLDFAEFLAKRIKRNAVRDEEHMSSSNNKCNIFLMKFLSHSV